MLTYNHEQFITQAIESVLMQETDFPIELVIGEDCSTDGTREIVKRYVAHYPEVVRALLPAKNIGVHANFEAVLKSCRGTYIAMLEGDDYWTSPKKLQKQVDFLDLHPDYTLCGTRFYNIQDDKPTAPAVSSPVEKESGALEDILRLNYLLTCTVVYRAGLIAEIPACFRKVRNLDMALWAMLAERGRVGFINEEMAAYRMHRGGIWNGVSLETRIASLEFVIDAIHAYFGNRFPRLHRESLSIRYAEFAASYSQMGNHASAKRLLRMALFKNPMAFFISPNVRKCLTSEFDFHFLCSVKKVRAWSIRRYFRTRIWAGAHRRRWSKATDSRLPSANSLAHK